MSESLGRPRELESRRRTRHLLQLLADGRSLDEAAAGARVKLDRAVRLLEEPEFWMVYRAIRDGRANSVSVAA